jgi:hypothetical protein
VGSILNINLTFVRSSLCLVHFSSAGRDGPAQAVDGDACLALVDEAWIPSNIDMTLSVIKSIKNSSVSFSTALNSFDMHTRGEQSWVRVTNWIQY